MALEGASAPRTPPPKGRKGRRTVDLSGLDEVWEDHPVIRKGARKRGALLAWVSPEKVGIIGMPSLKLNARVMIEVIKIYCPSSSSNKTVPVDDMKVQVTW